MLKNAIRKAGKAIEDAKKMPAAYLSKSGGNWRVVNHGMPVCRDTDEANARAIAARFKLDISHRQVWDGDKGDWVQE